MDESKYGTKYGGCEMTAEECLGLSTPENMADWLIRYHGAKEESRETIASNLRSQNQTARALGFQEGKASTAPVTVNFSLFGRK